jgi:hypothetical protein
VHESCLEAIGGTPKTVAIPVLPLSSALKMALLDELSANAPWRSLYEELVGQIGAALARTAASAGALVVEGRGGDPPAAQADAL